MLGDSAVSCHHGNFACVGDIEVSISSFWAMTQSNFLGVGLSTYTGQSLIT
jgi:hypothetical protein